MTFSLQAACFCRAGHMNAARETNLYFNGKCLEPNSKGLRHPGYWEQDLTGIPACMVLTEGCGENASRNAFAAANAIQTAEREWKDYLIPERQYLQRLWERAKNVLEKPPEEQLRSLSGAILYFTDRLVYVYSDGCPAFQQRRNVFSQLSGHVRGEKEEPSIIQRGDIVPGDRYLVCSTGVARALNNVDLTNLLSSGGSVQETAEAIVSSAKERAEDRMLSVIVCQIMQK